jgi:L-Ala-D/L-Glu epimerase
MRGSFEHAGAKRSHTDNVLCAVELDSGQWGYGEGVPRAPVTGETVEDSWRTLAELPAALLAQEVATWPQALLLADEVCAAIPDEPGRLRNATRAAIELSLLDALSCAFGEPLLPTLARRGGLTAPPEQPTLAYSLVVDPKLASDEGRLRALQDEYGYRAFKLKVGFGLEADLANLGRLRHFAGPSATIRMDANRGMAFPVAAALLERAQRLGVRAIEDPLEGESLEAMVKDLRRLRALGAEVILDEPVRTAQEAAQVIGEDAADLVNVRVSKCGGLLRAMDAALACREQGGGVQLGCQVGESAILSAAGRQFAMAVGDARYLEGSNERLKYLPEQFIAREDLTYGPGGEGAVLEGPGLGITVLPERLAQLSSARLERIL